MSISTLERERPCCAEVRFFYGLDNLLLTMEAVMDEAGGQLSDPRHFEQGKLCTAAVCVYARQHASIQGEARLPGASPETVYFKSELELLRLLRDWLEQRAKGGDTT